MCMAPARMSTAIPFGLWSDRADGGLRRASRKALLEVRGHHRGRLRRPTSAATVASSTPCPIPSQMPSFADATGRIQAQADEISGDVG